LLFQHQRWEFGDDLCVPSVILQHTKPIPCIY
jgi:hypothetical protein